MKKNISIVDTRINKLDAENNSLSKKLSEALNLDTGSQGMISDVQLLYNQELIGNWLIAFSIIGFIAMLFLGRDVSIAGVKSQSQSMIQTARSRMPGITSMIPGL